MGQPVVVAPALCALVVGTQLRRLFSLAAVRHLRNQRLFRFGLPSRSTLSRHSRFVLNYGVIDEAGNVTVRTHLRSSRAGRRNGRPALAAIEDALNGPILAELNGQSRPAGPALKPRS